MILVSEFSIKHIDILKMVNAYKNNRNIMYWNKYSDVYKIIIADLSFDPSKPEISIDDFKIILKELQDERLIRISDDMKDETNEVRMQINRVLEAGEQDESLPYIAPTTYGIQFLEFINDSNRVDHL